MGFKVEEKFRIILVMQEVNLTNGSPLVVSCGFKKLTFQILLNFKFKNNEYKYKPIPAIATNGC